MSTTNTKLSEWVEEVAQLTKPDKIHWCDGSEEEYNAIIQQMLGSKELMRLSDNYPNSYLHRSDPTDVARVEHLTFICANTEDEVGPSNNWMKPEEAHSKLDALFAGCMKGRTMYVIPYIMGPVDSPFARTGVEITDSPYVAINMRIMTRMGKVALSRIERESDVPFVRGLHSIGDLNPDRRYIMHFPYELMIKSYGSGYGGNALLGKKCHALRLASYQARSEGWMAEHMLIMGLEDKHGEKSYITAAFPSSCGKTNLAMLIPPETFDNYKVTTIGDDIAWLQVGSDGRLWAINPESGMFGVVPGTNKQSNPNALRSIQHDTIFTNVAVSDKGEPWWEGLSDSPPSNLTDWRGNPYNKDGVAAHPNSRFTVAMKQNPAYSDDAENPNGVPIKAILFGGRRADFTPLVYESFDWNHGVFMGAGVGSESTAASTGKTGVVAHDPMAMRPFCGYNMADYWGHWIKMGQRLKHQPKIFNVNWFRKENGRFMWPGFGDNLRVLDWVLKRCAGTAGAVRTPIGYVPEPGAINVDGLDLDPKIMQRLTTVNGEAWKAEMAELRRYFSDYGEHLPQEISQHIDRIETEISAG